jgi:hypothetical protein
MGFGESFRYRAQQEPLRFPVTDLEMIVFCHLFQYNPGLLTLDLSRLELKISILVSVQSGPAYAGFE